MGILRANNKVLDIIDKMKNSLSKGNMASKDFPLESVEQLLEDTVGRSFWNCITKEKKEGFEKNPAAYMKLFRHLVEQGDVKGCEALLEVYEMQYRSIYDALGKYEMYQETIRGIGNAWSGLQYMLHEERQNYWKGYAEKLPNVRGVIYTCAFDEDDKIYEPIYKNTFWDYICFTDREDKWGTKEGVWEFRKPTGPENVSATALVTYHMINPHKIFPDYDFSIWISPELQLIGEIEQWCEVYGKNSSFLAFPDCKRDNIYDHLFTCLNEDDMNIAGRKKFYNYRKEGYPEHYGMIDTRCIYRNHHDKQLVQVLDDWWEDAAKNLFYGKYCFNYVAWKRNFKFMLCNQFIEKNSYLSNIQLELG